MGFLMEDSDILRYQLTYLQDQLKGVRRVDDITPDMHRRATWCWLLKSGLGFQLLGLQYTRLGAWDQAAEMFAHMMGGGVLTI